MRSVWPIRGWGFVQDAAGTGASVQDGVALCVPPRGPRGIDPPYALRSQAHMSQLPQLQELQAAVERESQQQVRAELQAKAEREEKRMRDAARADAAAEAAARVERFAALLLEQVAVRSPCYAPLQPLLLDQAARVSRPFRRCPAARRLLPSPLSALRRLLPAVIGCSHHPGRPCCSRCHLSWGASRAADMWACGRSQLRSKMEMEMASGAAGPCAADVELREVLERRAASGGRH